MIIGVKYWDLGSSAPGSWTNLQVAECEASVNVYEYSSPEGLDGTIEVWKRQRYQVRLLVDPLSFNNSTYASVVAGLRKAQRMRIKDTRYSWLGDANTIDFTVRGNQESRSEPSLLTRSIEINGDAVLVHT